jgi:hypothetical protein
MGTRNDALCDLPRISDARGNDAGWNGVGIVDLPDLPDKLYSRIR